jgi:AcrR family transcriptional regulator
VAFVTGDEAAEGERRRRGRPPAHTGKDTKALLLDAARHCFCRKGYAQTSMAEIAGEAGVTARAIYHYVDSKSDLFAHTVEAAYSRFVQEVVAHVFTRRHDDTRSRLRGYTEVFRVLYREDPSLVSFMSLAALETRRIPELADALPGEMHSDMPNFNEMLVAYAVEQAELAPGIKPSGAVALLDVFGAGLTLVASKERADDYLAMLDVIDHLLDGSLFAK